MSTIKKHEDERPAHKTTHDLEDVTGNPSHRGVNPNQGQSMNPPPRTDGGMDSINEPPGSQPKRPPAKDEEHGSKHK